MRKSLLHITIFALALLTAENVLAQNSETAVMEVRANVVSGSTIAMADMSDETNSDSSSLNEGEEVRIGGFSIRLTEGTEILSEVSQKLELKNGNHEIELKSKISETKNSDGTLSLNITGENGSGEQMNGGVYEGTQVATIHYLY